MSDVKFVKIPLDDYEQMLEDSLFLNCLRNAGVDCWKGYDLALEEYYQIDKDVK